jgi:transcriptional regulator with XRE-family HTH domain
MRRKLTQGALAADTGVSTRYLSFIETGRARPSRAMVERLAEALAVPLDDRNEMLVVAGFAPIFPRTDLADPELEPIRHAFGRLLSGSEPYPAAIVDRCWNIRATNRGARVLTDGIETRDRGRTPNLVRLMLAPAGLARLIVNIEEWGASLVERVRRRAESTCDEAVRDLYEEVVGYPGISTRTSGAAVSRAPLVLRRPDGVAAANLTFFVAATTFPMARDATVEELSVETFFPADEDTRLYLIGKR